MRTNIYLACTEPLKDEEVFQALYDRASKERKAKIDRYRFQKDKMLSLGADALLRHALQEAGYAVEEMTLDYGGHGKPYLPGAEEFHFNLAHSGEYVMLAVSDAEIGCDIERIRPVELKLPKHAYHPLEYEHIAACTEEERNELFFRYWVLKESFIKALGMGLSFGMSSFRILLEDPVRVLAADGPLDYGFYEGADISGYRYAACRAGGLEEVKTEIVDLHNC